MANDRFLIAKKFLVRNIKIFLVYNRSLLNLLFSPESEIAKLKNNKRWSFPITLFVLSNIIVFLIFINLLFYAFLFTFFNFGLAHFLARLLFTVPSVPCVTFYLLLSFYFFFVVRK